MITESFRKDSDSIFFRIKQNIRKALENDDSCIRAQDLK